MLNSKQIHFLKMKQSKIRKEFEAFLGTRGLTKKMTTLAIMVLKKCGIKFDGRSRWETILKAFDALNLADKLGDIPGSVTYSSSKENYGKPKILSSFYKTKEWRILRYEAIKMCGAACQCCGAGPSPGKPLHVDHIKPRSKFPQLELVLSNLQVLCEDCNLGKLAWDQTDWRSDEIKEKMAIASEKVLWDKDTTWEQLEK